MSFWVSFFFMAKIDPHVHSWRSACSHTTLKGILTNALKNHIEVVIICDHDRFTAIPPLPLFYSNSSLN